MSQDQDPAKDWSQLSFQRRRMNQGENDPAWTRFWLGFIFFVIVALAYPWYEYQVNKWLLAKDLEVVTEELSEQADAAQRKLSAQMRNAQEQSRLAQVQMREQQQRRRLAKIKVMGTSGTGARLVMIVEMGNTDLPEAHDTICRQARVLFGHDFGGQPLRIQKYRGNQPAVDIGSINCE